MRRLYDKAKQLGTWDPAEIDLSRDVDDWRSLTDDERDLLFQVASLFFTAEEAVTRDLLPVAFLVGGERRLDDELFVTAWMWEEGKHADFFRRFLEDVVGDSVVRDPRGFPHERLLFDVELATDMRRLFQDWSAAAQARALTTYCLLVEGVLADTGQRVLEEALQARDLLPGLRQALVLINRDESRHVAYGLHVLRRLALSDRGVTEIVRARAEELMPLARRVADTIMVRYEKRPFGLSYALEEPILRVLAQLERLESAGGPGLNVPS